MAASKRLTATIIATSLAALAALAQAATDPLMDKALESTDPVGRLYYELETEWVQDKKIGSVCI
jgi:hypothetical protein